MCEALQLASEADDKKRAANELTFVSLQSRLECKCLRLAFRLTTTTLFQFDEEFLLYDLSS